MSEKSKTEETAEFLGQMQDLRDKLHMMNAYIGIPEAYTARVKFYIEEIRKTIEKGDIKLDEHFKQRLDNFFKLVESRKQEWEEFEKQKWCLFVFFGPQHGNKPCLP